MALRLHPSHAAKPLSCTSARWSLHLASAPCGSGRKQERYAASLEDERRLFYVALTRAEKYLTCSFAPGESRNLKRPSAFMPEYVYGGHPLTAEPEREWPEPLPPSPRSPLPALSISFSEWKYWSECPYAFKLRFIFGFNLRWSKPSVMENRFTTHWPRLIVEPLLATCRPETMLTS